MQAYKAKFLQIVFGVLAAFLLIQTAHAQERKNPIIVIPGLTGSELVNQKTGEVVWFKTIRSRKDDLRLPLSANLAANRDDLAPRDVLRTVKPGLLPRQVLYGSVIEALKNRGGYAESTWENPQAENALYVFAYDWRRDNVENARLLIQKIEAAKRKLNRPDLKFDVIAHSMGGLIARYAAMYGDADLPTAGTPQPSWAGGQHFDRIFLLGTPNEGALLSINAFVNGFSFNGLTINLPFVQNLTRFDVFTVPSILQLLPNEGTFRAFDENFKPLKIDVFDLATWDKYGWNPLGDARFAANFGAADRRNAKAYFNTALKRAKQFQDALNAETNQNAPVKIILIGAECKETLDAVVIRRSGKTWQTLFKPVAFRRADGTRASVAEVKNIMLAAGDGVVSQRSLKNETRRNFSPSATVFQCEGHNQLVSNAPIQDDLLKLLGAEN